MRARLTAPSTAITANHTTITGPNSRPTVPVPKRWMANRATRMATAMGTTADVESRADELDALDGRQHADRRRDHPVAEQQRRAEQPEQHQDPGSRPCRRRRRLLRRDQCGEREDAALAVVVGPQHQQHVLDGDDDHERPHDDRHRPHHVHPIDGQAVALADERLADRVQRARAEVAVDDAERADDQRHQPAGAACSRPTSGICPSVAKWPVKPSVDRDDRVAAERLEGGERLVERGHLDDLDVVARDLACPAPAAPRPATRAPGSGRRRPA